MADESISACLAEIKANPDRFYVYILSRPCGTPFYVGCGGSSARRRSHRIFDHERQARTAKKSLKCDIIRKVWREGTEITRSIDSWHDDADAMFRREMELIRTIGRRDLGFGPLANGNDGGTGLLNPTKATVEKIRRKNKAAWTPEMRAAASERASRAYSSSKDRQKQFMAMLDKSRQDESLRAAASERGKRAIENTRAANARMIADPVAKKVRWDKIAERTRSPEVRKKHSVAQVRNWADPAYRAAQTVRLTELSRNRSPEIEAKRIAAIRAFHAAKRAAKG